MRWKVFEDNNTGDGATQVQHLDEENFVITRHLAWWLYSTDVVDNNLKDPTTSALIKNITMDASDWAG